LTSPNVTGSGQHEYLSSAVVTAQFVLRRSPCIHSAKPLKPMQLVKLLVFYCAADFTAKINNKVDWKRKTTNVRNSWNNTKTLSAVLTGVNGCIGVVVETRSGVTVGRVQSWPVIRLLGRTLWDVVVSVVSQDLQHGSYAGVQRFLQFVVLSLFPVDAKRCHYAVLELTRQTCSCLRERCLVHLNAYRKWSYRRKKNRKSTAKADSENTVFGKEQRVYRHVFLAWKCFENICIMYKIR